MVPVTAPRVGATDWERLELPEGYTAEVIRGELVVSPLAPRPHGRALSRLVAASSSDVPEGYEAMAGSEWRLDVRGIVAMAPQPDVVVVRRDTDDVRTAPLLAVEVLSPSDGQRLTTGHTRIEGKRQDYAANGLKDYLEIDLAGSKTVAVRFELVEGVLVEVDRAVGAEVLSSDRPFRYRLVPIDLTSP